MLIYDNNINLQNLSKAAGLVIGFLWCAGCTDLSDYDRERVDDAIADSLLSVTESRNIKMELIEEGQLKVTVHAPYAATYSRNGRTETELRDSVYVAVRGPSGEIETEVYSRSARYLAHQSDFHFKDDVIVHTQDNRQLFADYLNWSQRDRTVQSSGFVIIVTPSDSITGYGLQSSDDLHNYSLSQVTGEFELERSHE